MDVGRPPGPPDELEKVGRLVGGASGRVEERLLGGRGLEGGRGRVRASSQPIRLKWVSPSRMITGKARRPQALNCAEVRCSIKAIGVSEKKDSGIAPAMSPAWAWIDFCRPRGSGRPR